MGQRQLVAVSAMMLLAPCGCWMFAGAAGGAGAMAYLRGDLTTTEQVTLDSAWSATQKALKSLEFKVVSQEKDALKATAKATMADNKQVEVKLKKLTDDTTEIAIHVGLLGDEEQSKLILAEIRKNF